MFQATRMDGNFFGYTIPADSFQAVNPIMILLFIPLFDFVIYPLLGEEMFLTNVFRLYIRTNKNV